MPLTAALMRDESLLNTFVTRHLQAQMPSTAADSGLGTASHGKDVLQGT